MDLMSDGETQTTTKSKKRFRSHSGENFKCKKLKTNNQSEANAPTGSKTFMLFLTSSSI